MTFERPKSPLERITAGHVITALLIIVSMAITWGSLSTRVDTLETNARQNAEILNQLRVNGATLTALASSMDRRITRMEDGDVQTKYNAVMRQGDSQYRGPAMPSRSGVNHP